LLKRTNLAFKKTIIVVIFITLALSTCWQLFLSSRIPELDLTSNQTFTFSTSYMHITDDNNELIIDAGSMRSQILTTIDQHPGMYFRELCKITGKEVGVIQYHVQILMNFKKICPYQDGRLVRYFINNSTLYDDFTKLVVSTWNRPIDKQILSEFYSTDNKKHRINQLARIIGVCRQTMSFHVNKLKECGLLQVEVVDGIVRVSLTDAAMDKLDFVINEGIVNRAELLE